MVYLYKILHRNSITSRKKMLAYRMNASQIIKFVELYKACQCLWDINLPAYKNRSERNQALNFISEEMKIDGFGPKEVVQKINNIRTIYKQELKKVRKGKLKAKSPDDIYKSKVPWFQTADSFLSLLYGPSTHRGSSTSIVSKDNDYKNNIIPTKEESSSQENLLKRRKLNIEDGRSSNYIFEATPRPKCLQRSVSRLTTTETEFDYWSRSLALQLNRMDVIRALKLQLAMQTLISNERMLYENSKQHQETQLNSFDQLYAKTETQDLDLLTLKPRLLTLSQSDESPKSSMFSLINEDAM